MPSHCVLDTLPCPPSLCESSLTRAVPSTPKSASDPPGKVRASPRDAERELADRRAPARRWRLLAGAGLAAVLAAAAVVVFAGGNGGAGARSHAASPEYSVGLRVERFVDTSRTVQIEGAPEPRTLVTYVRYPALGPAGRIDVPNAAPARGPFPLVVFGHGFALTPGFYAPILQAWARAGYVVAAPVFPLENAGAPGGPDEADLTNQPADMQFVISQMLALSQAASGPLAGLIDPAHIAVSGHSDGGDTALAVAYDRNYRDPRVDAVVVLAGAEIPGVEGFEFAPGEPPLLAVQGTADTLNQLSATESFFSAAARPKFLVKLLGASHLPPYSREQPQLSVVERTTTDFLDAYLKNSPEALASLRSDGNLARVAALTAEP